MTVVMFTAVIMIMIMIVIVTVIVIVLVSMVMLVGAAVAIGFGARDVVMVCLMHKHQPRQVHYQPPD